MKKTKISAILMIGALLSLQVVPANAVTTATNTPILGCVSGVLQGGVCVQQNSISVVPTTSQNVYSCPSGVLIGNSCEIAGGNIKLRPYSQYTHQVQYSWGSNLVCNDPTYSFNESNWPDAYCEKNEAPSIVAAASTTVAVCTEGTLTNGACSISTPVASIQPTSVASYSCNGQLTLIDQNCYTSEEVTNIASLAPFDTIKTWAKTYLLPAIIAFVLLGILIKLVLATVRKYSRKIY